MRGFKPDHAIWSRVNTAFLGENTATVMVTLISGLCAILKDAGVVADENHARAHLAAMLISPDDGSKPGSLMPQLKVELARLNDGKWLI